MNTVGSDLYKVDTEDLVNEALRLLNTLEDKRASWNTQEAVELRKILSTLSEREERKYRGFRE